MLSPLSIEQVSFVTSKTASLASLDDANDTPLFCFKNASISKEDLVELKRYARENLGEDPSSLHFMKRKKSIAFVYVMGGTIVRLDQDYFIQNESYNDFSGGYKRYYPLIPRELISSEMKSVILQFKRYYGIADGTIMLVQIQSSTIEPATNTSDDSDDESVTGQGIHTDGAERATLFCLERTNVEGAKNSFYADLDGDVPLCDGTVLKEGHLAHFKDNEIFHRVSPASQKDGSKPMRRSLMLIHSPARNSLDGSCNENNRNGTRTSSTRLREIESSDFSLVG
jgi:hypothetical protein